MNAFRMGLVLAVVTAMATTCVESPQRAKQQFMDGLVEFIHETELQSTQFTTDSDWDKYNTRYHDLLELEYPKHHVHMSSTEHLQVATLKERYQEAKNRYLKRRIGEKLEGWSKAIQDFWTSP